MGIITIIMRYLRGYQHVINTICRKFLINTTIYGIFLLTASFNVAIFKSQWIRCIVTQIISLY